MGTKNFKKVFLVVNRFAGRRKKIFNEVIGVISVLNKNGCEVKFSVTEYQGHATKLAAKAAKSGFDLVVAVGGDGTVNEVSRKLIGTATPVGIIPMGSGNGLARELGIPMKLKKSARAMVKRNARQIDVCRFNNQQFLCTSGIGFDAQVAEKMKMVKSRGFLRYVQLTIKESIAFKPFKIKMKVDGLHIEKQVFLVTFANARQFGNNAFIAPKANISDGLIDVVVVNPFPKIWLPVFGIGLFLRVIHKFPFVEYYKAKKIKLEYSESFKYHFDGEPGTFSIPAEIKVDDKKIFIAGAKQVDLN
jgi:diacylglycerol kinase (ATP)